MRQVLIFARQVFIVTFSPKFQKQPNLKDKKEVKEQQSNKKVDLPEIPAASRKNCADNLIKKYFSLEEEKKIGPDESL